MLLGIGVALYDTGLATTMSYGRIFYAIARDAQWPGILNRVMSRISRTGVPIGALLVLGAVNMAVMASSSIQMLVTLGGTLLMVVYAGIATASILDRIRQRRAPYQMPWWPIPPLAALAGLALLVGHLSRFHLILTGLVTLLGLTWAWASPTPRDL
jgi:amino acid transporter